MSTTGEAADEFSMSNSAASSPDMAAMCKQCDLFAAKYFCHKCEGFFCAACDEKVIHSLKALRDHQRMEIDDYHIVERGLGHSSPTEVEMIKDEKNKFCFFSPVDYHIHLLPLLASLVADPNARPSLTAFIGPTGVGKSTLLRLLISLDAKTDAGHMPLAGAPKVAQSTSSDIHMYNGGEVPQDSHAQSAVNSRYPLLYVDSEGHGGSKEPLGIRRMWTTIKDVLKMKPETFEDFEDHRFRHIQVSYPRMLYIFSDVVCFVFSADWREQESIVKPLLEWGQSAALGAANQHRPQLIIIFNKRGGEAAESEFDDFQETYKKWIGDNKRNDINLKCFYTNPLVCLIPEKAVSAALVLKRVKQLRKKIHECTEHIRSSREMANQLFTRSKLQLHMQLAADTFSKDPNAEFDIYTASMAARPPSEALEGYIVDFRREVEEAISKRLEKFKRYQISVEVVQRRIKLSVLLHMGRVNPSLPVGENSILSPRLQKALNAAEEQVDKDQPCAAKRWVDGKLGLCQTTRRAHESGLPHTSTLNFKALRWPGEFISFKEQRNCSLVKLAESAVQSAKTLNVQEIQKQLIEVRNYECDEYPSLKTIISYRVCISCMMDIPTEVLSCGHVICAMCAKEVANFISPMMDINLTCPICLSSAKWYPKDLPPLAGCRILSLDGGGIRGIVELLSLEKIMSFFPGMHVKDLFDIIVGTSTGGIIALALTVHEFNEQPKSVLKVIELFQNFCEEVFSKKMMRFGAGIDIFLRVFQFLGLYNTKYRNHNLLKLLKKNFGEQSLLHGCVGGPHVIVTACNRDNDLAGAWFTSYNRKVLENEDSDLHEQARRSAKEEPTRKLVFGRVPSNHLLKAKDVAAATSAAGTYFPSYEIDNQWWIDGGLRFNCPAAIAIQEARILLPKHRISALISLGCGKLSFDKEPPQSESLIPFLKLVVEVVTDSESQSREALKSLEQLQPNSSECGLRLNPTIEVPKGRKCELDEVEEMSFLKSETRKYLCNGDGLACVHKAANLLFAALFYLDVEVDQDTLEPKLHWLHIRSRAALPQCLQERLTADHSSFSFTVLEAPHAKSEFFWSKCTWDQNIMDLPFKVFNLPMLRPLNVEVKLHTCLPQTTVTKDWPLSISGMPYSLGGGK